MPISNNFAANRRYVLRTLVCTVIFVATLFIAKLLVGQPGVSVPLAYAVAVIPGLAMAGAFWAQGRLITDIQDEFVRMLTIRQQLIAMGFTMATAAIWGTLDLLKVIPQVSVFYIIVVWAVGTVVGTLANLTRFGTAGSMEQ